MQKEYDSRLGRPRFPALHAVWLFLLWIFIGPLKVFSFPQIGGWDYATTLCQAC